MAGIRFDLQVTWHCSGDTPVQSSINNSDALESFILVNELVYFQLQIQSLKYTCLQYKNLNAMQARALASEVHRGSVELFSSSNIDVQLVACW